MRYTAVLVPMEGGGFMALVPSLGDVMTTGTTVEAALANAREATELCLEVMADHGEAIPVEPAGVVLTEIHADAPVEAIAG